MFGASAAVKREAEEEEPVDSSASYVGGVKECRYYTLNYLHFISKTSYFCPGNSCLGSP